MDMNNIETLCGLFDFGRGAQFVIADASLKDGVDFKTTMEKAYACPTDEDELERFAVESEFRYWGVEQVRCLNGDEGGNLFIFYIYDNTKED